MDDGPMLVACRETTEMITEHREGGDLPWGRHMMLRFHLAVCPYCKTYVRQMESTITALGTLEVPDAEPPAMDGLLAALRDRTPQGDGG